MNEQTVKCGICGDPYVIFPMYVGDQSACSSCREKARRQMDRGSHSFDYEDWKRIVAKEDTK